MRTRWMDLPIVERTKRNEEFRRDMEKRIAEDKAKRKIQRKKDERFRHRLTIKMTNHMLNCKDCQEGTPCKKAYSLGLFRFGMNRIFEKSARLLSGFHVDELHMKLVPEKKKLDLVH